MFTHITACQLADGLTPPLSPRLRPLCYLRDRWDSYPVGTILPGQDLHLLDKTNLSRRTWTSTPDAARFPLLIALPMQLATTVISG